ncbi:RDD family protein [Bacillus salitolerans]|uniref:RDD family protein n=1 Tax=Bacillus salitolerans TaxID=1437434 RepID=A0ABW4LX34_9BACI
MSEIKLASRKSRILAYLIDHFVLSLFLVIPFTILMANEDIESDFLFALFPIWMIIFFIFYCLKDSFKGISLGKWVIGIGVRDENDRSDIPSIPRLFLRNLLLVIWPIEFIVLAINKNKQRLGDKVANTIVIKVREMGVWKKIVVVLLAIVISFVLFLSAIVLSMKNSEAYEAAITFIESNENIVGETGGIEGYGFLPSGSIQTSNGYGESVFTIEVKGKEKDIYVEVYLTKVPNQNWKVEEVHYE